MGKAKWVTLAKVSPYDAPQYAVPTVTVGGNPRVHSASSLLTSRRICAPRRWMRWTPRWRKADMEVRE